MNDAGMVLGGHGCKELANELCVCNELGIAVWEDIEQSLEVSIPGDGPIRMGSDSLSRSAGTDDELEGSDLFSFPVIGSNCIDSG
jgi:hypothetical protein